MTPGERYRADVDSGAIVEDALQWAVVGRFDRLHKALIEREKSNSLGTLRRLFRLARPKPEAVKGLYVWGGVGRGKTYLMDLFFEGLPIRKLRMHFHRFMRRVHHNLTELSGESDPLVKVAERFADDADVICFDEFFVSDIGDAMILAELFKHLFERDVTLVATSNVVPAGLYENGLQRRRFLPAIALIEQYTEVVQLDSEIDYRLRALEQAEIYHQALDATADASLRRSFEDLAPNAPSDNVTLEIEGRPIEARSVADDVVWFDFLEICAGPRSQNDYVELAMQYHAVLISNVPQLTTRLEEEARRFVSLVDEFYDHNVKLILSADAPIEQIYTGQRLAFEFQRTTSRLLEMQSHDYLARTHRA